MASTEHGIRETLIGLFNRLAELALRAMGLWARPYPVTVTVTVVWELELYWSREVPRVVADEHLGPEAAATLTTALGDLATRLDAAVADGADPEGIRREVIAFRDRWAGWARRVAVTESTRMASEAVMASGAARRPGAVKVWVSSHDQKVRSSHRDADGVAVPVAGSFHFAQGPVRWPGDPFGPLDEIVNCRCGIRIKGGTP